ncbi:hypothetical protein LCGC14_0700470 [marine sediment metagenome]|uniref:Uncharacterized protein n=1 Tax=marine sediment metagenome TaxID=412755 RepID=A0A0F9T3V0_9ZZZZ|nr:hypothetical protein [Methylophaga sp.]HEC58930.1 hypothetical protein [Methylophaga sp.]
MTYNNYIIAIGYEGKIISYDYYLTISDRKFNLERNVYPIRTSYEYYLNLDQKNEIVAQLQDCIVGKATFPHGYASGCSMQLGDLIDDYGYEPRIWDICMGHI